MGEKISAEYVIGARIPHPLLEGCYNIVYMSGGGPNPDITYADFFFYEEAMEMQAKFIKAGVEHTFIEYIPHEEEKDEEIQENEGGDPPTRQV